MTTKKCPKCEQEKDMVEFRLHNKKRKDGTIKKIATTYCTPCVREISAQRNQDPKFKRYLHNRYLKNRDELKKTWQTTKFKEGKRKSRAARRRKDKIFKLRENISNAVGKAMKKGKSSKAGQSILRYLGYAINDLKIHLENRFDEHMTWQNYGTYWHLDHIIPQSDLPYTSMTDDNLIDGMNPKFLLGFGRSVEIIFLGISRFVR